MAESVQADAIEVLNPHSTYGENKLAEELARARSLSGVAGSDAHKPREMWMAYTRVNAQTSVDDVLDAIKRGRIKPSRA